VPQCYSPAVAGIAGALDALGELSLAHGSTLLSSATLLGMSERNNGKAERVFQPAWIGVGALDRPSNSARSEASAILVPKLVPRLTQVFEAAF
jgi:hypothetical protein